MNLRILSLPLLTLAIISGCSSSTTTENTDPHLSQQAHIASLVPGGFVMSGTDTLVCFDVQSNVELVNPTSSTKHFTISWEFGTNDGGVFVPNAQFYPYPGLVSGVTSIDANSSYPLTTRQTPMLSTKLRGKAIACRITVNDAVTNSKLFSTVSNFDSVPFDSRYHGYIYTVESSPDALDTLDRPEDGDWKGATNFIPSPSNPNPVHDQSNLMFTVPAVTDSVVYDLHVTPRRVLKSFVFSGLPPGMHSFAATFDSILPGLYRFQYHARTQNMSSEGHGDIRIE